MNYSILAWECGTSSQVTAVALIRPTKTGCMTETPTCAPSTPVAMGKNEPPVCAKTKTNESAVARISGGKILVATDTAYISFISLGSARG